MILSYIAACCSLIGIMFNIKKNPICWFCFMASDSLWLYYFCGTKQYAPLITHVVFIMVNFYGMYIWSKNKQKTK
jgi:nicotinamide riboside transporter PnuC